MHLSSSNRSQSEHDRRSTLTDRRRRNTYRAIAALIAATALLVGACSSPASEAQNSTPKSGGTATVALAGLNWTSFDPGAPDYASALKPIMAAIYGALLYSGPDGKPEPGIATSGTFSPDGLTFTLAIRKGVKFQDGTDLDPAAVKFNLDRVLKQGNAASSLPNVTSVSLVGDDGVALHLSAPNYSLVQILSGLSGGASFIGSPTAIKAAGAKYGNNPVGAGPYKFSSQVAGSQVKLVRNPSYYGDAPYLDGLNFTVVTNGQQAMNGLTSGDIDFYYRADSQSSDQASANPDLKVLKGPETGFYYISLNTKSEPFANLEARKAVATAIDQQAVSKSVFFGQNTVIQSVYPPGSSVHQATVPGYPAHDQAQATTMVAGLGGLSFTLDYGANDANLAQAVASELTAAGMTVQLEQLDHATLFGRYHDKNFTALIYEYGETVSPNQAPRQLMVSGAPFGGGYSNAAIDGLVKQAETTADQEAQKQIYATLSQRAAEDLPLVYLGSFPAEHIAKASLQGVIYDRNAVLFDHAWIS